MTNEVKFTKHDIDTLKSLYNINQTLKISADNTELRSLSQNKTCACIAQIDTKIPRTFCIYDLREFTGVLNIIEDPVVDFSNDKYVIIKSSDGRQKLKYMDGSENLIDSYFDREFSLPSEDIKVNVSASQIKAVMNAASSLKLEFIGFKSVDGKILLQAFDRNNGSGDETNGFSIEVGETTSTFQMFYKTEALAVLDGDCTFEISFKKLSKITNGNKLFWMTLHADSSAV